MSTRESTWFKSSYSGSSGDNCVEVAVRPEVVRVRDTKDVRIHPLTLSPTAWSRFTADTAGNRD
ncbi:DUF397 domain-containing protein [Embleya sp. NBC_00896]|uniref:DUF397 domain-containing protein n=1 Tax=Embleya sp. NBC_00896 TaxID=2975961 RepID=UPI0038659E24|nr:DUF397 domain-containing protein [Embleya sp. NBC_00896]